MPSPRMHIQAVGLYKLPFEESDVMEFSDDAYGDTEPDHLAASREELDGIYIIELLITGRAKDFDIGDISQSDPDDRSHSTQVPYDESFWSADGELFLDQFRIPNLPEFRVVFFLHSCDPLLPLVDADGTAIPLPQASPFPPRLAANVRYQRP